MQIRRVRLNSTYTYQPVFIDRCSPPVGVMEDFLQVGDRVKVISLPGCPRPNTMGHCYIAKDGKFAGLVCCNSLQPTRRA